MADMQEDDDDIIIAACLTIVSAAVGASDANSPTASQLLGSWLVTAAVLIFGSSSVPFMFRFQRSGSFWKAVSSILLLKDSDTDSCDRLLSFIIIVVYKHARVATS